MRVLKYASNVVGSHIKNNRTFIRPTLQYTNRIGLHRQFRYDFSTQTPKFLSQGGLFFRNRQTLLLKLQQIDVNNSSVNLVDIPIPLASTIGQLKNQFCQQFNIQPTDVQFCAQQTDPLMQDTPLQALINQCFLIIIPSDSMTINIRGQAMPQTTVDDSLSDLKQNLRQLQLPVLAQRQFQAYFKRVQIWLDAKHGKEDISSNLPKARQMRYIKTKDVQDILVQSLLDPQFIINYVRPLEIQWVSTYWEVEKLRGMKEVAMKISQRMARTKMTIGLGLLAANTAFIWSGTYVFFSWDIIQPIAYFTSSLGSIVLFFQAMKLGKPFSLQAYREYLIQKYLPRACEKVGLNLEELQQKERILAAYESSIKDLLVAKL